MKPNFLKSLLFGLIATTAATQAYALGGSVGNGGDAVVCRNAAGQITSAELLDYYEGRTEIGGAILLNGTRDEALQQLLAVLGKTNVASLAIYRKRIARFSSEASFVANVELVDIPDSDHAYFPKGCKVEQLAIQKKEADILPGQKRYIVNLDIWNKLDGVQQAGLIFHEVVYTDTLNTHSRYVRVFNALIAMNKLKDLSASELFELLAHIGNSTLQAPAAGYVLSDIEMDEKKISSAKICAQDQAMFDGVKIRGCYTLYYSNGKKTYLKIAENNAMEFQAPITKDAVILEYTQRAPQFGNRAALAAEIYFYENGAIKSAGPLKYPARFFLRKYNQNITCAAGEHVYLLQDGTLQGCTVAPYNILQNNAWSQWTIVSNKASSFFILDATGSNFVRDQEIAYQMPNPVGLTLIAGQWLKTTITITDKSGFPWVMTLNENASIKVGINKYEVPAGAEIGLHELKPSRLGLLKESKITFKDGQSMWIKGMNCNTYTGVALNKEGYPMAAVASRDVQINLNGRVLKFPANKVLVFDWTGDTLIDIRDAYGYCPRY